MFTYLQPLAYFIVHSIYFTHLPSSLLGPGVPGERKGSLSQDELVPAPATGGLHCENPISSLHEALACAVRVAGMAGRRAKETGQCGHVVLQEQPFLLRLSETGMTWTGLA